MLIHWHRKVNRSGGRSPGAAKDFHFLLCGTSLRDIAVNGFLNTENTQNSISTFTSKCLREDDAIQQENLPGIQDAIRIKYFFDPPHDFQIRFTHGNGHIRPLGNANTMLAR